METKNNTTRFSVRIDKDLLWRFKLHCVAKRTNITKEIHRMIDKAVDGLNTNNLTKN